MGSDGLAGRDSIAGAETSVAAFVGVTREGPVNQAVEIASFADFERDYGGLDRRSPVSFAVLQFFGNGGTRGIVVRVEEPDAAHLVGSESDRTGIHALLDTDLFNLLLVPDTFDMTNGEEADVVPQAVSFCERRRAFYIVDAPSNRTAKDIGSWAQAASRSPNAAAYFPPVCIADPNDSPGSQPRTVAPSGTVAGLYARTDAARGVWKAPAGTEATLKGVLELGAALDDRENARITSLGVNVLRAFPGRGAVAWGARTMAGAGNDEYKYVPVRRLALFLEESLYRGTKWALFEPNDEPLWTRIRLAADTFLNSLFRLGAFQGATPSKSFFVKCDSQTTTASDRENGLVNILVGFAPLRPAEFVLIRIQQTAARPG
ncbi:MAG TPA: phage tail sheath subtilisin-like domain-containing protein [Thermoanaerobaculia bacterium]|nr:phage tail sheath subtilisin-like domain-containing protein [Thermoanaerobaculia bacterium]